MRGKDGRGPGRSLRSAVSAVAAELVNSRSGLGYIIIQGMKLSDPGMIIGGMLIITVVSLIFTQGMTFITNKLCPWQREIENL